MTVSRRKKVHRIVAQKKAIDFLRKRDVRYSELVDETELSEKTVGRILGELKIYGLVVKQEDRGRLGKWVWYDRIKNLGALRTAHSEKLTLTIGLLSRLPLALGITEGLDKEAVRYIRFAEDHLRTGYPNIHSKLIEYRDLIRKEEGKKKELEDKTRKELSLVLKEKIVSERQPRRYEFVAESLAREMVDDTNIGILNALISKRDLDFTPQDKVSFVRDILRENNLDESIVTKTLEISRDDMASLEKIWDSILDIGQDLNGELDLIAMKVEMGISLLGNCELCP